MSQKVVDRAVWSLPRGAILWLLLSVSLREVDKIK